MSSNRIWVWTGRLAALVAAVVIPACGSTGSPGGTNPNGILWNSIASTGGGGNGAPVPPLWVDPNDAQPIPIGINNIITSADDATYDAYYPVNPAGVGASTVIYIRGNFHPLSTDTGTLSITTPENALQQAINGYRQQRLGNVGGGGGGGLGGGVVVGGTTGIILSGHFKGTKSARAHCKHYALFHQPGMVAGVNAEGDDLLTGGVAGVPPLPNNIDQLGRLGKIEVTAFGGQSIAVFGPGASDSGAVFSNLVLNYPAVLISDLWTNLSVGHWRGGSDFYYWNIIFLTYPTPPV